MGAGNPNWKPGVSGNPNGRPRKERALTNLLEAQLDQPDSSTGEPAKVLVARLLLQGITTGKVEFPDGRVMTVRSDDWLDFVKLVFNQVDGPARADNELALGEGVTLVWDLGAEKAEA